jgi:hypothetical protein
MKKIALALLVAVSLGGCVVLPVGPGYYGGGYYHHGYYHY